MATADDSFDAAVFGRNRPKGDADDGEAVKFGVFYRVPQPAVRIIDSDKRSWLVPFHWTDIGYEEDGALVIRFANGYQMTARGDEVLKPLHLSVMDYFRRQVIGVFRVGAPAVVSIVVEKIEE